MEEPFLPTPLEARLRPLMGEEPDARLRDLLAEAEAFEIADALYHFSVPEQQMLLGQMAPDTAAEVLTELNESALETLLEQLPTESLTRYVSELEPDDAADLVALLPPERVEGVMAGLDPDLRVAVTNLLAYGPETAGGIMDPDVVQVRARQTVATAVEEVRRFVARVELDEFFVIFAVNDHGRLVGVVPTWRLLLAEPEQRVEEVMLPEPVSVEGHLDQEHVARLVMDHDLVTVPVVDAHRRLIGRITVDDVVDVIQEEHQEDLGHLTGTGGEPVREPSVLRALRSRAPWLVIAFVGQFFAAMIMRSREDLLVLVPQFAFFIPVIMAMGGNTGIQSSSLVIQGLATGELRLGHFWRRLAREVMISICFGLAFALVLAGGGVLLTGRATLGVATGVAIFCTITIASTIGIIIPMVLKKMRHDPALATGPFITTVNDLLGIMVYLAVAYAIIV